MVKYIVFCLSFFIFGMQYALAGGNSDVSQDGEFRTEHVKHPPHDHPDHDHIKKLDQSTHRRKKKGLH